MVGGEPSGLLKVELLPSVTCVEGVGGQKKEGRNGGGKGKWRSHDLLIDRGGGEEGFAFKKDSTDRICVFLNQRPGGRFLESMWVVWRFGGVSMKGCHGKTR